METEKRIWDMRKKDYARMFARFWLVLFLLAIIVGTAIFLSGYYDQIINKNYTSSIDYMFAYTKKIPDSNNPGSFVDQLSDPSLYLDLYKKQYTSSTTIKEVESVLEKEGDKKLAYKAVALAKFIRAEREGYALNVTVTTKVPEHSKKIAEVLFSIATKKIEVEKDFISSADKDSVIEITTLAMPALGINYISEEETIANLVVTSIIIAIVAFVGLYLVVVVIYNFNGKFKRLDVFENNFQIPAIGEVVIRMYKEV